MQLLIFLGFITGLQNCRVSKDDPRKSLFIITHGSNAVDVSLNGCLKIEQVPGLISCSVLCVSNHACRSFFYNPITSMCVLQGDLLSPKSSSRNTGWKFGYIADIKHFHCNENGDTLHQEEPTFPHITEKNKHGSRTKVPRRLLLNRQISLFGGRAMYDVNLGSNKVESYLSLFGNASFITDLYYMKSTDRLYITNNTPLELFSCYLNGTHKKVHNVSLSAISMDGDDRQQMLFISMYEPTRGVGRFSIKEDEFKTIFQSNSIKVEGCSVDPKRKRIYIAAMSTIISVTYEGQDETVIESRGRRMYTLAFDSKGDILYYFNKNDIFQKHVHSNNASVKICSIKSYQSGADILTHGNHIYFIIRTVSKYETAVFRYSIVGGGDVTKIQIDSPKSVRLRMCLIQ